MIKIIARQVIENDKDINNLDYDINEKYYVNHKTTPIATDLRMMMYDFKNFHRL